MFVIEEKNGANKPKKEGICDCVRENQAFVKNIYFFTGFLTVYHRYTIVENLKSIARSSPEI